MRIRVFAYLLLGVCVYALLCFLASRSVYYPMKYPEGAWGLESELGAADAWIIAPDGVRLHAWMVKVAGSRFVTLFLHGNAGNLTHRELHFRNIAAAGSSVLIPDYRGYGRSSGRPTEKGLYRDADAAYEYLLARGYRAEDIIVHGESLGTSVAVHLASRRPCAGVVLESAFPSARAVAGTVLPVIGPLLVWGFDALSQIGAVRAPLFFIHGDHDDIIPLRLGRSLYDAAPEPKSMWIVSGAGHNDLVETAGSEYVSRLSEFYARLSR